MPKSAQIRAFPLSIASLVCWGFAIYFPLAEVKKLGLANASYLASIGSTFRSSDQLLLGILADTLILVVPTLLFLVLPIAAAPGSPPLRARCLRLLANAKSWAMPDVFALSILVAFVKLGSLANASITVGFYFLLASVFLLIYLLQALPLPAAVHLKSRTSSIACLISASLLIVPANVLPIMELSTLRGESNRTIIGGVSDLASHGLWGIAAIVFAASILVPFGKLGSLSWLLFFSNQSHDPAFRDKLYRVIDFIGRWSMLDIFLIGALAGLVDFGSLSSITPGPAAPAFAASVILTIIAVERFDPRANLLRTSPLKANA